MYQDVCLLLELFPPVLHMYVLCSAAVSYVAKVRRGDPFESSRG